MKRILVPTDFSKHATDALKVAAQIAKKNQGEIILLHMLELPSQGADAITGGSDIPEIMFFKNAALQRLEKITEADYLKEVSISYRVLFERAFEGIVHISRKNNIDFIVMGSHGASGFQDMFIGSNTEKVVRTADVPVLVIKGDMPNFSPKKLVFASDFSDEIKKPFQKIIDFANFFGAHLHLVMINTPNNFKSTAISAEIMQNFTKSFNLNNFSTHVYNDTSVEKGVLNFSNNLQADVIGMCTHGRTGFAHFFNGSISEDLVNHSARPVITVKI
jgi:nucleotide-binding universal stress UspA family protein